MRCVCVVGDALQASARYHARVFVDWRRHNQIVVLLPPSPTDAAVFVSEEERPRRAGPPAAASQDPVPGPQGRIPALQGPLSGPQEPIARLQDAAPGPRRLYVWRESDGRWMFGALPATSVSDTAVDESTPI